MPWKAGWSCKARSESNGLRTGEGYQDGSRLRTAFARCRATTTSMLRSAKRVSVGYKV